MLAGTGTLRAERYRRLILQPERREERHARGLAPDPLAVVLSRSGDLPDIELLTDPEQPRAVFTGADADPASALRRVRQEHGVLSLLCEGGPTLLDPCSPPGSSTSCSSPCPPVVVGGDGARTVMGPPLRPPVTLELVHLLEHDDMLFTRYRIGLPRG